MPAMYPKRRYLNNFIDKNFQDMFFPFDIVMSILVLPKYNNADGFVTPIDRMAKLKSLMMNVILLIATYFRFATSFVFNTLTPDVFGIITLYVDLFYYSIAFSLFFISNIINSTNNVNFVLNLQKAFRNLYFIEMDFKHFTICNWMSVIVIPIYYIFFMVVTSYGGDILGMLLNFIPLIYFDVNMVYIIRITWTIHDELRLWVKEMRRHCNKNSPWNGLVPEGYKMLESYCFIIDAFSLLKKISLVPIALHVTDITSHALMYLQVTMDQKKQMPEISVAEFILYGPGKISISMWMFKLCLLMCILCYALEKFYFQVREAEQICCAALNSDIPDNLRQLCKNVVRYRSARFAHLDVCGVRVDARLPLRLAGVAASYIVVVLQLNLSSSESTN